MALKANALQRALPDFFPPAVHFKAHALTQFRRPLFATSQGLVGADGSAEGRRRLFSHVPVILLCTWYISSV